MLKIKKIVLYLLILISILFVSGCKNNIKGINIEKLSGETCTALEETKVTTKLRLSKMIKLDADDETDTDETVGNTEDQPDPSEFVKTDVDYTILFKPDKDIKLTVTLTNPKKISINALEIQCDDLDATIYVNDGYGNSSYKALTDPAVGGIINWTSSSAIQMTFYMQISSPELLNSVRITDIKLMKDGKIKH